MKFAKQILNWGIVASVSVVLIGKPTFAAKPTDTERELRDAVALMNSWLSGSDGASGWREFLLLNILDAQAALGFRADPAALNDIRHRFNADTPGLDHPVFRHVRQRIDAHLAQLSRIEWDIPLAAEKAKSGFQQTTIDDLKRLQADAIFYLRMLKQFYKQRLTSRERGLLYFDLQPDDLMAFLEDFPFELPPTRTKVVINQEISDTEQAIRAIEAQIQQLDPQREKIENWLRERTQRPADATPPIPDDSSIRPSTIPSAETLTSEAEFDEQDVDQIVSRQIDLKQDLTRMQRVRDELQRELRNFDDRENQRLARFREALVRFNNFLAPYEAYRLERQDIYFSLALESLWRLKSVYLAAANPTTERQFLTRIDRLIQSLERVTATNDRRGSAELGNLLGWIEAASQAPDLVAAIRSRFSRPNFYLEVSNGLVNEIAGQEVLEIRPVNEQILSRLVRGYALVQGDVQVKFAPDPYQVRATIDFSGTIDSDTYARDGKFTAFAGAFAPFAARRELLANLGGMFAGEVYGDLQIESYFKSIDSQSQLVQRIARKQFQKTKCLAERESTRRTRQQLFPQFETLSGEALQAGFEQYEALNRQMTDTRGWLPAMYLFTTADRLVTSGHRATNQDLAATNAPQYFDFLRADLHAKIHESLASNYLSPLVAGKRLTNRQIAEQFQKLLGLSSEIQAEAGDEEVSITFVDARPIQFEFDENEMTVAIYGREFTRGETRIRDGLIIRLVFRIEQKDSQLQFTPVARTRIELIVPERRNIATVSFMSFLEDLLNDVLSNAAKNPVHLPANLIPTENLGPQLKDIVRQLQLMQLRLEDAWLYLSWKHVSSNNTSLSFPLDLPSIWQPESSDPLDSSSQESSVEATMDNNIDITRPLDRVSKDADTNYSWLAPPSNWATEIPA